MLDLIQIKIMVRKLRKTCVSSKGLGLGAVINNLWCIFSSDKADEEIINTTIATDV